MRHLDLAWPTKSLSVSYWPKIVSQVAPTSVSYIGES